MLSTDHPTGPFVEVNLTPIGGFSPGVAWKDLVQPIRIRSHETSLDPRDKRVEVLPENISQAMIRQLGPVLTQRLLTEDFLPQIDWDLYRRKCNGGANLEDIRRR
ncbi:hypothetical protein KW785_01960 [Candidatus Parcubacteria bacterium]|nr:hypothetical protein [Candidatus Parcubacteria bacterium]